MSKLDEINELIEPAVEKFKELDKFRVVSHYDADGISAAAIILATILRSGKKAQLSIVKQIRPDILEKLKHEGAENIIFTDLGSGYISKINELDCENLFVLDHHQICGELEKGFHINPHLVGAEENSISGSGVTYLFSKEASKDNRDLSVLAVIGAIGDMQEENWVMKDMNEKILKEAVEMGLMEKRKGLRLFGRLSRPVHRALQYTTRPYLPRISENESGSVQFLSEIDIDLKHGDGSWKKLSDLEPEDRKKLATALIKRRINHGMDEAEEIFGDVYNLKSFDGKFRDARELSTALNACGRMSQGTIGVLACIGDPEAKDEMSKVVKGYKRTLGKLVRKVRSNEDMVKKRDGLKIIEGRGEIPESFIGTVCSILQSTISKGEALLGISESEDEEVKISARLPDSCEVNLGEILGDISEELDGEGGGHEKAGGAYIKGERVEDFLEMLEERLSAEKAI